MCNLIKPEVPQDIRPNKAKIEFLNLALNKFYDILDTIMNDDF